MNEYFQQDDWRLVHRADHLEVVLVAEAVAEDVPEALESSLERVRHRLLPRLLNTQGLKEKYRRSGKIDGK